MDSTVQEMPRQGRCWVEVISLNHVHRAIAGGFLQTETGRDARLARLQRGDRVVCYSPRTDHPGGKPLQEFTGWGVVTGERPYRLEQGPAAGAWRIGVRFEPCVPVPVARVRSGLGFLPDGAHWGIAFRRGFFAIPAEDFDTIVAAMGALRLAA